MTVETQHALHARREALSVQLQAQRQVVARRLAGEGGRPDTFPRSKTMELLTQQPELVVRALSGLTRLFRLR